MGASCRKYMPASLLTRTPDWNQRKWRNWRRQSGRVTGGALSVFSEQVFMTREEADAALAKQKEITDEGRRNSAWVKR